MPYYEDTLKKNCKVMNFMLYISGCLEKLSGGYNMVHMYLVAMLSLRSSLQSIHSIYLAFPDHLDIVAFDTAPLLSSNLVVWKFINFVKYRIEFFELKKIMAEKFWAANADSSPEEQEVILRYSRYVHFVTVLHTTNCSLAGILWVCKPMFEMYVLRGPDEPFHRILPLLPWWPFLHIDCYEYPLYPFEYFLQVFQMISTVVCTIALFCLYVFFVLHTCAQFKILQMRVKKINSTINGHKVTIDEQERRLRGCIQMHKELLNFCNRIAIAFTMPLFCECIIGIMFICLCGFAVKLFPGNFAVTSFCTVCAFGASYILFFSCFLANYLTTESFNVAFSAYDIDWYDLPVYLQREIMFMISRSQEPVYFSAGGFTNLSLETFESIMRTAVSYFTVLNTMNSNE